MNEFVEGNVVICTTHQAGTLIHIKLKSVWVLLANGDIWVGNIHDVRLPQDQADLDSCPFNVERLI